MRHRFTVFPLSVRLCAFAVLILAGTGSARQPGERTQPSAAPPAQGSAGSGTDMHLPLLGYNARSGGIYLMAVLFDSNSGDAGDAIQIGNSQAFALTLDADWTIVDAQGQRAAFPGPVTLQPGSWLWVANQATIFGRDFGFAPDYEWGADSDGNPANNLILDGDPLTLDDSGGVIRLKHGSAPVVDQANGDGGPWPGGSGSPDYRSMERRDPAAVDGDDNWGSHDGLHRNGLDAEGNPINGSPRQANSIAVESSHETSSPVVINEVAWGGTAASSSDEWIELKNNTISSIDLQGWRLTDGNDIDIALAGTIAPQGYFLLERTDDSTIRDIPADQIYTGSLLNSGESLRLLGPWQGTVDALVYGDWSQVDSSWTGPAVQVYVPNSSFAGKGQLIYRKLDETYGLSPFDHDNTTDWAQDPADPLAGKRVRYPGWDLERFFQPAMAGEPARLTIAVAPDNAAAMVSNELSAAQSSLQIAAYEWTDAALVDLVVDRLRHGVSVQVLLDGTPAGGLSDQERWACAQIETVGGQCWFAIHDPAHGIYHRYSSMHAKYAIVDGRTAVISSQNFTTRSFPADDKADGTLGERGLVLITDSPAVVARTQAIFAADCDPAHADIKRWTAGDPVYGNPTAGFTPDRSAGGGDFYLIPSGLANAWSQNGTYSFEVVQSPENSLRTGSGVLGLIGKVGLGDTLLVESLYESKYWGPAESNPEVDPNVRLEAYVDAARRGATVHILLDSWYDAYNRSDPTSNYNTVDYVNGIAAQEHLALEARLGNPAGLGLHNKMILASIGGQGWIHAGSLNGSEVSSKANRELALQVQTTDGYNYLKTLFDSDWQQATPVNHLLITEIIYSTGANEQFVELYNPTAAIVDLSGYKIGDAEVKGKYEGMLQFPAGASIGPRQIIVVAQNAQAFKARYPAPYFPGPNYEMVDGDPLVPNMLPYPAWGQGTFELNSTGDEVLLLDQNDAVVDVLNYGASAYPGVRPHPLVSAFGSSLQRFPPEQDNERNDVDVREWPYPNPGTVP